MTKSDKTYEMEEIITLATWKLGTVGCAEVGLGDAGIVDYITIELGGDRIVRCYELKITKSDFLSDAKKTFIGEFNYYVIPTGLWMQVKNYIEPGIGCITIDPDGTAHRKLRPKRRKCTVSKGYITTRIMQALYREYLKGAEASRKMRQLSAPVEDYERREITQGCIVEYNKARWVVNRIEYGKHATASEVFCHIVSISEPHVEETVKPSMLRVIQIR